MPHPDDELLVDLALAPQTDGAGDHDTLAHVATCDKCRTTVAEVRRTLLLTSSTPTDAGWRAPPATVWSRITADIEEQRTGSPKPTETIDAIEMDAPHRASRLPESPRTGTEPAPAGEATPTTTPPAPIELRSARQAREPARLPRLVGWAVGLAAAGLVIGLLTGRALWHDPVQATTTITQVALNTLDTKQPAGEAAIVRTGAGYDLTVDTKPIDAGDGYLEVWLINRDGKRMVSVGVLPGGGQNSFPIDQTLIDQGYVIVDVSREHFDDKPAHSGDSVVRGTLPA